MYCQIHDHKYIEVAEPEDAGRRTSGGAAEPRGGGQQTRDL